MLLEGYYWTYSKSDDFLLAKLRAYGVDENFFVIYILNF